MRLLQHHASSLPLSNAAPTLPQHPALCGAQVLHVPAPKAMVPPQPPTRGAPSTTWLGWIVGDLARQPASHPLCNALSEVACPCGTCMAAAMGPPIPAVTRCTVSHLPALRHPSLCPAAADSHGGGRQAPPASAGHADVWRGGRPGGPDRHLPAGCCAPTDAGGRGAAERRLLALRRGACCPAGACNRICAGRMEGHQLPSCPATFPSILVTQPASMFPSPFRPPRWRACA